MQVEVQPPSSSTPRETETVMRPEPGIARGRWEAPAWAFWVALAVVLVAAGAFAYRRIRALRKAPPPRTTRTSSRPPRARS